MSVLRRIRFRSLRSRIIAWSFVPTAIILFVVALVTYFAYQQVAQDLVVERNQELARLSAGQLADELDDYSARLASWAQTASPLIHVPPVLQSSLQQASSRLAIFDGGVVVLDGNGMVLTAEPERTEILGQDWSDRAYFRKAASMQRPVFSGVVDDGPDGNPVIVVTVPILGVQGDLQGVAAGMFRLGSTALSSFYGSIVKLHIGGSDTLYLVDGDGRVLYHADTNRIGADFSAQSAVQQVLAGNTGAFRARDWAGREIVASFAPVPGASWGLVIEADWHALLRARRGYQPLLLGLLALGVILPAIVVGVGVRRITRPVSALIDAAQQVASGNFGYTVSASTGDEIEALVQQFNRMSVQLAESYSALQQSEERFSLAMQGANDGLWDWDLRTNEVYYSPRWKSMLGYGEDEIEPDFSTWERLVHPDDRQPAMKGVEAFRAGDVDKFEIEFRMRHKDGYYLDVLSRAFGARQAQGGPIVRLVGTHVDITDRKRAEEALRDSEAKFRAIVEFANIGIAIVQDARFRFVNPHCARMLGYTVEDMLDTEFMGYCAPEERERVVDFYERRARGDIAPPRFETAIMHKNGPRVYVEVSAGVIPYEGGSATFVFLQDITKRRQVEEELRRQNEYLAALHETTLGVVSRLDVSELLQTIVERAVKLLAATDGIGFVFLVRPEVDRIELEVGIGRASKYKGMRLERGEGIGGRVWELGQPIAVDDYQSWSGRSAQFEGEPLGPELGVPLKSGSEVVGVIGVGLPPSAPPFGQDEINLIDRFGQLASIALDNARLHTSLEQRVQERTHELATLNTIAAVVSRTLDLQEVMSDALDTTLGAMGMDLGVAYRLEGQLDEPSERPFLSVVAYRGISAEFARQVDPLWLQGTLVERAAAAECPVVWLTSAYPTVALQQALEREGVQQGVSVPLLVRGKLVGALVLAARSSRTFAVEDLSLLAAVGQQVGVAVENARLYEAEQERRDEAERRRRVAEGMRDIVSILNSSRSLREILDYTVQQACRLLEADAGFIARFEPGQRWVTLGASHAWPPELAAAGEGYLANTTGNRTLLGRQPFAVRDLRAYVQTELPRPEASAQDTSWHERVAHYFRAVLAAPLVVEDNLYGALALYYREPRDFSEEDYRLGMTLTDQLALAIENAKLREQAEQAAAIAERSRLARELHDSVTQSLYSVTMYAEAAARLLTTGQESVATEYLRDARDTAQEALREMRLLIFELRPLALEQAGLAGALQARLDAVEKRGGVQAELRVEGVEGLADADWLPLAMQQELYHIAQEALNNSLKHAKARHLQVSLQLRDTAVRLEISDDGIGFDPSAAAEQGGLGLRGMKERVQRIGGQWRVESAPGQGTKVTVDVPRGEGRT
jgi:PAS domain S-box-containing protein